MSARSTIGIVGGMGLEAGIEFERKVCQNFSRSSMPESSYPRVITISDTSIPDRSEFLLRGGKNPASMISQTITTLGQLGADVIALPCNTSHAPEIMDSIISPYKDRLVSIIDAVRAAITDEFPGARSVGLMATDGTVQNGVYASASQGRELVLPVSESQQRIMDAIYDIKNRGVTDATNQILQKEFHVLLRRCDVVVLGCTELSLSSVASQPNAIDSLNWLAESVIKAAINLAESIDTLPSRR